MRTELQVRQRIRAYIDRYHDGSQAAAAREWGYSRQYVNAVLRGRIPPNGKMRKQVKPAPLRTLFSYRFESGGSVRLVVSTDVDTKRALAVLAVALKD